MNIELAVVSVVFGPFILIRFLQSLGAAAASAGQGPPPRFQPKQGLNGSPSWPVTMGEPGAHRR